MSVERDRGKVGLKKIANEMQILCQCSGQVSTDQHDDLHKQPVYSKICFAVAGQGLIKRLPQNHSGYGVSRG